MRVTLGELRDIAREGPAWRPRPVGAVIVTPASIRTKAICIYHEEGHSDALAYLGGRRPGSLGLSATFGPDGPRAAQGRRTSAAFDRYVRLDRQDGRPYAELTLGADVSVGRHQVGATADVVVFDQLGYSGRTLSWNLDGVTDELAELLALPVALAIDQELGADTCVEVVVWDLEHNAQWVVDRAAAHARARELARVLDRIEASRAA